MVNRSHHLVQPFLRYAQPMSASSAQNGRTITDKRRTITSGRGGGLSLKATHITRFGARSLDPSQFRVPTASQGGLKYETYRLSDISKSTLQKPPTQADDASSSSSSGSEKASSLSSSKTDVRPKSILRREKSMVEYGSVTSPQRKSVRFNARDEINHI